MLTPYVLVVDFVSFRLVEYEEVVPAVRREHLQGTVSQEVAPLVDLSYCAIRPLDTANECGCVCRGMGDIIRTSVCMCVRVRAAKGAFRALDRVLWCVWVCMCMACVSKEYKNVRKPMREGM